MDAASLRPLVESFQPQDEHDRSAKERTLHFLDTTPGIPWSRKNFEDGHLTSSAWILDSEGKTALLFNHKKLERWLQIGGHIEEGDEDFFAAMRREVLEESGLRDIEFEKRIFDIDVHLYPARKDEPDHYHYDVRVLVRAKPNAEVQVQAEEGHELRWIPLEEMEQFVNEESILRMARKSHSR